MKQGLEPATGGFPLNRLNSVPKSGTYRASSVVLREKKTIRERLNSALYLRLEKFSKYAQEVFIKNTENNFKAFRGCSSSLQNRKKLLVEAGTRTCDRWVSPKSIKLCTKKWYIQSELCGLTRKKNNPGTSEFGAVPKARKVFKICAGSFYQKHRKQFQSIQRLPFVL